MPTIPLMSYNVFTVMDDTYWTGYPSAETDPYTDPVPNWGNTRSMMVKLHPQARALTALLDSRTDWTEVRQRLRTQTLAGIKMALTTCAPNLDDKEAEDIADVVLNNMKTMVGMTMNVAPTTPGAPDQLRLMNRLYLTAKLAPQR